MNFIIISRVHKSMSLISSPCFWRIRRVVRVTYEKVQEVSFQRSGDAPQCNEVQLELSHLISLYNSLVKAHNAREEMDLLIEQALSEASIFVMVMIVIFLFPVLINSSTVRLSCSSSSILLRIQVNS